MLSIWDKLEKNVCRIFLENKGNGTGFLLNNKFILTDFHVVENNNNIQVKFDFDENFRQVTLLKVDKKYEDLDIAVLELDKEIDFYEYIEINGRKLQRDEQWLTRGYPSQKSGRVEEMRNDRHVIHQHLSKVEVEGFDIELNFDTTKWSSYRGLSGSPIIVEDCIVGIITSQQIDEKSKELYGLSIRHFKDLINEVTMLDSNIQKEIIEIEKDGEKLGEITIETVPVEVGGKILHVSIYPVTFEEYDLFCEDNDMKKGEDRKWDGRNKRPAIYIDLINAKKYCTWLTNLSHSKKYLLPSSREWLSIAEMNEPSSNLEDIVWYNKNETAKIGNQRAGKLGIYDMYGNIEEWCSDKISIGGSFRNSSLNRIKEKIEREETDNFDFLGFRVIAINK